MKATMLVLAAVATSWVPLAYAQSGPDVLKAKGCLNCHEADKKKVGPSFKDTAAKNKDDKDAETRIVAKLKEGKGHPKVAASDAELKAAVSHVLSGK